MQHIYVYIYICIYMYTHNTYIRYNCAAAKYTAVPC